MFCSLKQVRGGLRVPTGSLIVALIHRVHSDEGVLKMEVPYLGLELLSNTTYDWNYTTIPQTALDNRVVLYSRGRVLGGSSSISEFLATSF